MGHRMIKAIALDIDGTLLNSKKELSNRTKLAVAKAMERGVKIIIASGRPYSGVEEYAKELGIFEKGGYILCFNGGQIQNCFTGEIIYDVYLEDNVKYKILDIIKQYHRGIIMTYRGNVLLTENGRDEGIKRGALHNRLVIEEVEDLSKHIDHRISKFIMQGSPEYIESIVEDVRKSIGNLATVCRSEKVLLEFMPFGVDKGTALAGFVERMGLQKEEIMACGDSYNDDTMIAYAGIGVAMGNAVPEIKQIADYITCSNDEDGVAVAIEKFVLNQ